MKFQRLLVAASLALLLMGSAPVARADGMTQPDPGPHGFVAGFAVILSEAVAAGLGIVSATL